MVPPNPECGPHHRRSHTHERREERERIPPASIHRALGPLGATTLLTSAGVVAATPATANPAHGGPSPAPSCPTPPAPGGANPCPPPAMQSLCGAPTDTDPLWQDVQYCTQGIAPPTPPPPTCLKVTANDVVLHGRPENTHNCLLLPSCRITGIECPFIHTDSAPNYWRDAWENARSGGSVPVQYRSIGLGINSQGARHFNQLHIHMAGVMDGTQRRLQELESQGRMATQPSQWAAPATRRRSRGIRVRATASTASSDSGTFSRTSSHCCTGTWWSRTRRAWRTRP
ncbi:CDP-diacylglycerol diphosphatase [Streptomyces sp. Amel2xB2]|uniref:CDP-diacylglycerol diphosphatase n=1 Tax=Streptomyces sp. Amel2xB2 TaxID=1305829 RepID=UPI0035CD38B7